MEGKVLRFGSDAQSKVLAGVSAAADAIAKTLGPSGKCVAINNGFGSPEITRDGATVAKSISFKDKEMNMGAELVKKAASLTESQAGDSTSTTSILINEICKKGRRALNAGANVNEIKSGMLKAGAWMEQFIKEHSIPVEGDLEKIRRVATISANNDPAVGELIVHGMEKVGIQGVLTSDLSAGLETEIAVTAGMRIERGWNNPHYINKPEEGTCELENPYVLLVGEKISNINQLMPFLEFMGKQAKGRPFLIICDDIDTSVSRMLIYNVLNGAISCCVVKAVEYGDARKNIMQDIAVATGGQYLSEETGNTLAEFKPEYLGGARKIVISSDSTVIYEFAGDAEKINARAEVLRKRLEDPKVSDYERSKFEKRIAGLVGGIGVISAGGATEAEKQNRKATIDDAILASKSAIAEGCLPGGGYIYLKGAEKALKDEKFLTSLIGDELEGAKIVFSALPVILHTIAENSGDSGDVVVKSVMDHPDNFGYNAKTRQFGDLIEEGILDSTKAVRIALENAISTASMILLIDCTIVDEEKDENEPVGPGM